MTQFDRAFMVVFLVLILLVVSIGMIFIYKIAESMERFKHKLDDAIYYSKKASSDMNSIKTSSNLAETFSKLAYKNTKEIFKEVQKKDAVDITWFDITKLYPEWKKANPSKWLIEKSKQMMNEEFGTGLAPRCYKLFSGEVIKVYLGDLK